MPTALSIQEAQAQLSKLVAQAARGAGPCYIKQNAKEVAVLVGLQSWRARRPGKSAPPASAQARSLRAYRKRLNQLGPDFWLRPEEQLRLRELIEKEDVGAALTNAERRELRRLLRLHERLFIKRAAALQAGL